MRSYDRGGRALTETVQRAKCKVRCLVLSGECLVPCDSQRTALHFSPPKCSEATGWTLVADATLHPRANPERGLALRYRLKATAMKIAEKGFTAEGVDFPAGSFIVPAPVGPEVRAAVEDLGLTAAALTALPAVPAHDAGVPRIAT